MPYIHDIAQTAAKLKEDAYFIVSEGPEAADQKKLKGSVFLGLFEAVLSQIDNHISEQMPHVFQDLSAGKAYKYGLRISVEGYPQLIYEEII